MIRLSLPCRAEMSGQGPWRTWPCHSSVTVSRYGTYLQLRCRIGRASRMAALLSPSCPLLQARIKRNTYIRGSRIAQSAIRLPCQKHVWSGMSSIHRWVGARCLSHPRPKGAEGVLNTGERNKGGNALVSMQAEGLRCLPDLSSHHPTCAVSHEACCWETWTMIDGRRRDGLEVEGGCSRVQGSIARSAVPVLWMLPRVHGVDL